MLEGTVLLLYRATGLSHFLIMMLFEGFRAERKSRAKSLSVSKAGKDLALYVVASAILRPRSRYDQQYFGAS